MSERRSQLVKCKLMKLTIVGLAIIVGAGLAGAQSPAEKQLFDLVNHERQKAGVSRFEWSDKLAQAALAHSKLLDRHQELSHQFAGEPPLQQRVGVTGLRFNSVAENVAEAPEVETAHKGLMNSPGHRANILNPDYSAIGIAIVQDGGELFVTQDFAHVLASYTEKQFQDAVIGSVTRARRAAKLPALDVISDARLHKAACKQEMNTDKMIQGLPGAAKLLVFSQSEPGPLSPDLRQAIGDRTMSRMNIGVCLESGGKNGFSHFWVVTAFYPEVQDSRQ
jgi:cysteine-rich secretory family protein